MINQDKINEINKKHNQDYKLSKSGRIYSEFMGKKQWYKLDEIISRLNELELERNANNNVKITCKFIEEKGGKLTYKSMYGSNYYDFNGFKVRVSNHEWTSDKHVDADINLCSYDIDGYIEMIGKLN